MQLVVESLHGTLAKFQIIRLNALQYAMGLAWGRGHTEANRWPAPAICGAGRHWAMLLWEGLLVCEHLLRPRAWSHSSLCCARPARSPMGWGTILGLWQVVAPSGSLGERR